MGTSSQRRRRLSKSKQRELRQEQARKVFQTRRQLANHYENLPQQARAFLDVFRPAFSRPTFLRFVVLVLGAILTVGCRTTSNLLRTLGLLAPGDPSSYHRFFSARRWQPEQVARLLAGWIFRFLVPNGTIHLAADDTVSEHPGDKVHGKGCHRDAVRSSHSYTAFRWGHKWLVLAVLVPLPFTRRRWALPLLVVLCHSAKEDEKAGRRHHTPAQRLAQLLLLLRRWFPDRTFVLAADGGFASHELSAQVARHKGHLTLVSRFYANAGLYEPPPELPAGCKRGRGRPRVKGAKGDTPQQAVAKAGAGQRLKVSWYGGGVRLVELVSGVGHWYKAGQGLVEVRWVYVKDCEGTHRAEYFYTTAVEMSAVEVVEAYARRWNLETTFQEMRSYLGLETTRGWKKETVLRAEPCLFGLYSVVACLYLLAPAKYKDKPALQWRGKKDLTFSDALSAVRKWLWVEGVFVLLGQRQAFEKMPEDFQEVLLAALAPAA